MSNRRVKAIEYEDDGDYSDDYDETVPEQTEEDKRLMEEGKGAVKEILGDAPITDVAIEEALWHYYYDVAKTVDYLLSEFKVQSAHISLC
jgi:elongation factor 1 alpha-like protein